MIFIKTNKEFPWLVHTTNMMKCGGKGARKNNVDKEVKRRKMKKRKKKKKKKVLAQK